MRLERRVKRNPRSERSQSPSPLTRRDLRRTIRPLFDVRSRRGRCAQYPIGKEAHAAESGGSRAQPSAAFRPPHRAQTGPARRVARRRHEGVQARRGAARSRGAQRPDSSQHRRQAQVPTLQTHPTEVVNTKGALPGRPSSHRRAGPLIASPVPRRSDRSTTRWAGSLRRTPSISRSVGSSRSGGTG